MRRLAILALSLLGLFDSSYLWWVYTSPSHPMVCFGGGCDVVRASSYAHLWGLPLPIYGVAMYVVLALLVFLEPLAGGHWARTISQLIVSVSGAGVIFSAYLSGLEEFVLHAWCTWCVISAITVTLIFLIALLELLRPSPPPDSTAVVSVLRKYVVVALLGVFAGIPAFVLLSKQEAASPPPAASSALLREYGLRPNTHITGNPDSPVTVIEFGDFQCPVCGVAEQTMRKIRLAYGQHVRFAFRQYPIPALHANAEKAAEASECAADQGKFWQAYEKFYDNQNDLTVPALELYAGELGLDKARFNQCLESGAMASRVAEDVSDAHALGVDRTPMFFVDDQVIVGAKDYADFAKILDQELQAKGVSASVPSSAPAGATNGGAPAGSSAAPPASASASSPSALAPSGGNPFGGSPSSIFSAGDSSLGACSEEEARQKQPALINTEQAHKYFQDGSKALFVDVRPAAEFAQERISGAINIPLGELEKRFETLPKDRPIIFYESGRAKNADDICASGRAAGRYLLTHGFSYDQVRVYQDGLQSWEKAGFPTRHGAASGS